MNKSDIDNEMLNIKCWFNYEYAPLEQKYRRLHTLGDTTAYNMLFELYKLAEEKRARYNELEVILNAE